MTTATVTVYLNEDLHHHSGLHTATARLRPVSRFGVTLAEHVPADQLAAGILEIVFEQLNIPAPQHQWARDYRAAGHRSLSVGDVVVVGDTAWACAPVGWQRVAAEQLHT